MILNSQAGMAKASLLIHRATWASSSNQKLPQFLTENEAIAGLLRTSAIVTIQCLPQFLPSWAYSVHGTYYETDYDLKFA